MLKMFEIGKTYVAAGGYGSITITGRTKQFITFTGDWNGRKKVINDTLAKGFGAEYVLLPCYEIWKSSLKNLNLICSAE